MKSTPARGAGPELADEGDADLLVYMGLVDDEPSCARAAWEVFYRRHVEYICIEFTCEPTAVSLAASGGGGVGKCNPASGFANLKPSLFSPDAQVEENLARAARKGGKIPSEIEERMRRDRKDAERQPLRGFPA